MTRTQIRTFITAAVATAAIAATFGSATDASAYKLDRAFVKSWSTSGDADDRPAGMLPAVQAGGGESQSDAGYQIQVQLSDMNSQ